jgi:plasmid stability protein
MKTNITLKLDSEIIREVRVMAAEQGTSISALLGETLKQVLQQRKGYLQARRRALARLHSGMELHFRKPRSRDELYER